MGQYISIYNPVSKIIYLLAHTAYAESSIDLPWIGMAVIQKSLQIPCLLHAYVVQLPVTFVYNSFLL